MMTQWNTLAAYLRARFGDTERGASLVEYALLLALITVVCIIAIGFLGESASSKFESVGDGLNSAN
jgi:pilus assembly protein Flp/PilA